MGLGLVFVSDALAQVDLYQIDFSAPTHVAGETVKVGGQVAGSKEVTHPDLISWIAFGDPVVAKSFGELDGQALVFDMLGNEEIYYYDQIKILLPEGYIPALKLDFDFDAGSMVGSRGQFTVLLDTDLGVRNVVFRPDGTIYIQNVYEDLGTIGTFDEGEAFRVTIVADFGGRRMSVYKNGTRLYHGRFDPWSVSGIRMSYGLTVLNGPDESAVGVDNIKIVASKSRANITWSNPPPIQSGVPLSDRELNATANVPGSFVYSPGIGTVLGPGTHLVRSVFYPENSTIFESSTVEMTIVVEGAPARLVALSARAAAGSGDRTLIVGFVVQGNKQVLVQGIGPGIAGSVPTALTDPQLKVYRLSGGQWDTVAENNDWVNGAEILQARTRLGASAVAQGSKDAALLQNLSGGVYSAHVTSPGAAGVALVETYDADASGSSRLKALATRTVAGAGDDTLIAGLVLEGSGPKTLLIRGLGPTLASRDGVTGVLGDPRLKLYRMASGTSTLIGENDNWGGSAEMKNVFTTIGAGALESDTSKDAAMLATLEPGVYTVHVTGAGTTGVALVEIFDVE